MTTDLQTAVAELVQYEQQFANRELSSVGYRDQREPALARALRAMATELGVTLQEPLQIDANGEYSIVALKPDGCDPRYGCGAFGAPFAEALSRHRARTGITPSTMDAANGWCRLFHLEAEKMVRAYAQTQAQTQASA